MTGNGIATMIVHWVATVARLFAYSPDIYRTIVG